MIGIIHFLSYHNSEGTTINPILLCRKPLSLGWTKFKVDILNCRYTATCTLSAIVIFQPGSKGMISSGGCLSVKHLTILLVQQYNMYIMIELFYCVKHKTSIPQQISIYASHTHDHQEDRGKTTLDDVCQCPVVLFYYHVAASVWILAMCLQLKHQWFPPTLAAVSTMSHSSISSSCFSGK